MNIVQHRALSEKWNALISEQRKILRIAFCGRFKSGKTSLLNLLLDLDLPVKAVTATGTVTRIQYGIENQVEFKDGVRKIVSKKELDDFIKIKRKDIDGISRSEAVTAFVGSQNVLMNKGNVEFWDTPGLDDDKELQKITIDAINNCDVVVFVLDALQYMSSSEKNFLTEKLKKFVGTNIIVVVNRMDMIPFENQHEVINSAQDDLRYFGNGICGYGPVFTSASPIAHDIDLLKSRIVKMCESERNRTKGINIARKAKIFSMAQSWRKALMETHNDIDKLVQLETKKQKDFLEQLTLKHNSVELNFTKNISSIIANIESIDYWENILGVVKDSQNWEKNYVSLSTSVMQNEMNKLFHRIRKTAETTIDSDEYPHCFPLPAINTDLIWQNMDWGHDFNVDNATGMMAGVAAGAVAGSFVPGVGTAIGAFAGFLIGIARDVSKDSNAKTEFQNSCISNTIREYNKKPCLIAKAQVKFFQEEVLKNMEVDFNNRKCYLSNEMNDLLEHKSEIQQYIHSLDSFTL